jgi:hypothetical protein
VISIRESLGPRHCKRTLRVRDCVRARERERAEENGRGEKEAEAEAEESARTRERRNERYFYESRVLYPR